MRPLYIFDLDGTLALTDHRQYILDDPAVANRWKRFFAMCIHDKPCHPVLTTFGFLRMFADIQIWSGRSDEVREQTVKWLAEHSVLMSHEIEAILTMREQGDYTPDETLKMAWLDALSYRDRKRLVAVFDDRDKVVDMWRSRGVACFQVARGTF